MSPAPGHPMIGARLGPYEVTAKLGEGGMGEVWRATDSKLGREVAIKVLPAAVAADAKALARFESEARAVAALSHPNILGIHELGRDGDTLFVVTELLVGETLRERIERDGALGIRATLDIGAQVARGLAAAHEKGIVHRDVKPANLFLLPDGRVKILDFGLARQAEPLGSRSGIAAAPTMGPATEPGTVLGTAGYMAPEQVRGEPADASSDIFALGVVLYEMATGERAFGGETGVETMTAILRQEPPQLGLPDSPIPPALERIVRHCLEKRSRQRFRSAEDLAFALENLAAGATGERSGRAAAVTAGGTRRRTLGLAVAALALVAAGAAGDRWLAPRPAAAGAAESAVLRPTFRQLTRTPGGEGLPTLSPDGETFVFVKRDGGDLDLFAQRTGGLKAMALTEECAADDSDPAFSPDGRSLAFRSECGGGGIFVMGATGESRRRVSDFGYQPAWSPDGSELAVVTERLDAPTSRNSTSILWAVRVDSGERRQVSDRDAMGPTWSPDGRRIAFWGTNAEVNWNRDLWSVAADGSQRAAGQALRLVEEAALDWAPAYSRDGRWLYFVSTRGGTFNLWRLAVDPDTGARRGVPEPLTAPSSWAGPLSLSADGRRAVFVDRNHETEIVRAPLDVTRGVLAGAPAGVFSGSFELREQRLSPDGEWILFTNEDLPQHLHLVRPDGTGYRQLTEGEERYRQGAWSPRGDWIALQTTRGDSNLAVIRPDGGGWQSLPVGRDLADPRWAPDGTRLSAFRVGLNGVVFDLTRGFTAPIARELPPGPGGEAFGPTAWSPDGDTLAGVLARAGQPQGLALFSLAGGGYRPLAGTEGCCPDNFMTFVGPRHLTYHDGRTLWLRDVEAGESIALYTPDPGRELRSVSGSRDGRWLTWIERADESDIWLMTLEEPEGPPQ